MIKTVRYAKYQRILNMQKDIESVNHFKYHKQFITLGHISCSKVLDVGINTYISCSKVLDYTKV